MFTINRKFILVAVRCIKYSIKLLKFPSSIRSVISSLLIISFGKIGVVVALQISIWDFLSISRAYLFFADKNFITNFLDFHSQKVCHQPQVCHIKDLHHFPLKLFNQPHIFSYYQDIIHINGKYQKTSSFIVDIKSDFRYTSYKPQNQQVIINCVIPRS